MKRLASASFLFLFLGMTACNGGGGGTILPDNRSPSAVVITSNSFGYFPVAFMFDASLSSDSDGSIVRHEWDLDGNGTFETDTDTASAVQHSYEVYGAYRIRLRVTDDAGATATDEVVVSAMAAPLSVPEIVQPAAETFVDRTTDTDSPEAFWLKNCYQPQPGPYGVQRVYQNTSLLLWAEEIYRLTNVERVKVGMAPFIRDDHLEMIEQAHCRDMALRDYLSHETPEGFDPAQRLEAVYQQPPDFSFGENFAAGHQSPADVVTAWMQTPQYRANILDSNLTFMGVGLYFDAGSAQNDICFGQLFAELPEYPNTHEWLEIR
jgi:uncharacterized protein YkwD